MSQRDPSDLEQPRAGESFLQRFSRRKLEARGIPDVPVPVDDGPRDDASDERNRQDTPAALTDADMPPLTSLTEDSDYSGFLSEKVSETLRRAALRKLFHSTAFNVIDELDDYAEDFTTFETLGDIVTADMRHQIELAEQRRAEQQLAAGQSDSDNDDPQTVHPETEDSDDAPDPELLTAESPEAPSGTLNTDSADTTASRVTTPTLDHDDARVTDDT